MSVDSWLLYEWARSFSTCQSHVQRRVSSLRTIATVKSMSMTSQVNIDARNDCRCCRAIEECTAISRVTGFLPEQIAAVPGRGIVHHWSTRRVRRSAGGSLSGETMSPANDIKCRYSIICIDLSFVHIQPSVVIH